MIRTRLISMRIFDAADCIRDAEVMEGTELAPALAQALRDPAAAYIQLHFAKHGCFGARVDRAEAL